MQFAYANHTLGYLAQIVHRAIRPLLAPVRLSVFFFFSILAERKGFG